MKRSFAALVLSLALFALPACSKSEQPTPPSSGQAPLDEHAHNAPPPGAAVQVEAPPGAKVFFTSPTDGAKLNGPLTEGKAKVAVKMGVENIVVQPAGEVVKGTGHHHIIVDGEGIPLGTIVPKDETHLHFGKGQTEAELELPPGEHKLTLQFADGAHVSYGPSLSSTIKVKVEGP